MTQKERNVNVNLSLSLCTNEKIIEGNRTSGYVVKAYQKQIKCKIQLYVYVVNVKKANTTYIIQNTFILRLHHI